MPSRTISQDTPLHKLLSTQLDYTKMRVFGYACWPNLHAYNDKKLSFKTSQCLFIGYSASHKGYKCFDRTTGRVYISRDVVFDENVFPFSQSASQGEPSVQNSNHPTILPLLAKPTQYTKNSLIGHFLSEPYVSAEPVVENDHVTIEQTNSTNGLDNTGVDPQQACTIEENAEVSQTVSSDNIPPPSPVVQQENSSSENAPIQHPMRTRLCDNVVQPKQYTDGTVRYSEKARGFLTTKTNRNSTIAFSVVLEPRNLQEAMKSEEWRKAMNEEYSAL
jgi:hypothetical protein